MTPTLPVWISDMSLTDWSDTVRLETSLPTSRWPRVLRDCLEGTLDARCEGLVDPVVPVGVAQVDARPGGFVPEPDWVLLFGAPLAALPPVGPETPCVLQGMIDGKWVGPLADAAAVEYASVSAGGNLVAGRGGIATTLGAITELRGAVAGARVRVAWRSEGGEAVESALDAAALARLPIVDIVRDLARWSFQAGVEVRAVALGASGELNPAPGGASDAVGEAILGELFRELLALCPEPPEGVIARVRARRWKTLADRGALAAPGLPMTLTVTDGDGRVVGEGAMRLTDG